MITITPPKTDEYASFYAGYIGKVPLDQDLFVVWAEQPLALVVLVGSMTDDEAATPHKFGEWSVKQILGHINDTERIFGYRALRIARGDTTPLAGFDQDPYVANTDFNVRSLKGLLDEFSAHRAANILCFTALTEAEIDRRGTASDNPVSARAIMYMMPGHVIHHIESIKADYQR